MKGVLVRRPEDLSALPNEVRLRAAIEHAPPEIARRIADELAAAIYRARDLCDLRPLQAALFEAHATLYQEAT